MTIDFMTCVAAAKSFIYATMWTALLCAFITDTASRKLVEADKSDLIGPVLLACVVINGLVFYASTVITAHATTELSGQASLASAMFAGFLVTGAWFVVIFVRERLYRLWHKWRNRKEA